MTPFVAALAVSTIVTDGVRQGRPRCGVHLCKECLPPGKGHFCQLHSARANICVVIGCEQPVMEKKQTCSDPIHQAVEATHRERSRAAFQLKNRIQRAKIAHLNDLNPVDSTNLVALTEGEVDEEEEFDLQDEEEFEERNGTIFPREPESEPSGPIPSSSEPPAPQHKIRAQFGRQRTHNEQLIVAPCGVIIARETFYNAEAIPSVVVGHAFFSAPLCTDLYPGNDQASIPRLEATRPHHF